MSDLKAYLNKRGITEEQMQKARQHTQAAIDAYNLREAHKASMQQHGGRNAGETQDSS